MWQKTKYTIFLAGFFLVSTHAQTPGSLTITSGNIELNEGFNWAKNKALQYVHTGQDSVPDPCYQGFYLHEEAYALRDILHMLEGAYLLGLNEENFSMMRKFAISGNQNSDECRLKWPYWKISVKGEGTYSTPLLPGPFEFTERAYEQYLWTGDQRWINDPDINEFIAHTNNELVDYLVKDGNEIISIVPMLDNCDDGSASYWSLNENTLSQSADAAGSQYQSYLAYSKILEYKGEEDDSGLFQDKAENLQEFFIANWYSQLNERYISGFITDKTIADDISTLRQSMFPLIKRMTESGIKTEKHISYLHSELYKNGISIDAVTYLPEAFYHQNANHLGWHWLLHNLRSKNNYPEVSFLSIRNIISGLMGISANAPEQKVTTLSRLVNEIPWTEADNVPAGTNYITVRHDGQYTTTFSNKTGPPIIWEAQFYGSFDEILVNGVAQPAMQKQLSGEEVSYIILDVDEGETIIAAVAPQPGDHVFLSDLNWANISEPDNIKKDMCGSGYVMTMSDPETEKAVTYSKGLGTKNSVDLSYDLYGAYFLFIADIGIDAAAASGAAGGHITQSGTVVFSVFADDEEIYNSGPMQPGDQVRKLVLDVEGAMQLRLVTTVEEGILYPNWANARLTRTAQPFLNIVFEEVENVEEEHEFLIPGDEANLIVKIQNSGKYASSDTSVIECIPVFGSEEWVTVNNPQIIIGEMAPGTEITRAFNVQISANTPKKIRLYFKFIVRDGDYNEEITESILTAHPLLDLEFERYIPEINGLLKPGESAQIRLKVSNTGTASSGILQVVSTAEGENSEYAVLSDIIFLPPLEPGSSVFANVNFGISDDAPKRKIVNFIFSLYDKNGVEFINYVPADITTAFAKYYASFVSLDGYMGFNMISPGEESILRMEVTNLGIVEGEEVQLTVSKAENTGHLFELPITEFDLGIIPSLGKVFVDIPLSISKMINDGDMIALQFLVDDGDEEYSTIRRFVNGAVYCSDMQWTTEYATHTPAVRDFKAFSNTQPIMLGTESYAKGIGAHSVSQITIDLEGKYTGFMSDAGIHPGLLNGSAVFAAYADGELAWESGTKRHNDQKSLCDIDVTDKQRIVLVVTDAGDGINGDHANWAGARLKINYNIIDFTINAAVSPSVSGIVNGAGIYTYGDTAQLIAIPNFPYKFDHWMENGDTISTQATLSFVVYRERNLVAVFKLRDFEITAIADPPGAGIVSGGGIYKYGQMAAVTAVSEHGYEFLNWSENGEEVSASPVYSFIIQSDRILTANFRPLTFVISATIRPANAGIVTGTGTYLFGQTATVKAVPDQNHEFSRWTEDGAEVSQEEEYSFTVNENKALVANFNPKNYVISAITLPVNSGTVKGTGIYQFGSEASVTAIPEQEYYFLNWAEGGNNVSTSTNYVFTVEGNRNLLANFVRILLPQVTTIEITDIKSDTVLVNAYISSDGGADVSERGIVWSKYPKPRTGFNMGICKSGNGTGLYSCYITEFEPDVIYYVRAYAINSAGTAYGDQKEFIYSTTSTVEHEPGYHVKLYPNPFSEQLEISAENLETYFNYDILSSSAQLISSGRFRERVFINTRDFKPGIYIIKLNDGRRISFIKAIRK